MNQLLVFDEDAVMSRVENDLELLRELVEIFIEEHGTQISELEGALAAGDAYGVNRKAHSIKSALGNLGGMLAHAAAFELEKAGKEERLEQGPLLLQKLKEEIAEFLSNAAAFLESRGFKVPSEPAR